MIHPFHQKRKSVRHLVTNTLFGAGDRARTGTASPPGDFKSPASANSATPAKIQERVELAPPFLIVEAPPGLEPGVKDLQSSALPLGYGAISVFYHSISAGKNQENFQNYFVFSPVKLGLASLTRQINFPTLPPYFLHVAIHAGLQDRQLPSLV